MQSCVRNQNDTSEYLLPVWLLDLKFLIVFAAVAGESSIPPHERVTASGALHRVR